MSLNSKNVKTKKEIIEKVPMEKGALFLGRKGKGKGQTLGKLEQIYVNTYTTWKWETYEVKIIKLHCCCKVKQKGVIENKLFCLYKETFKSTWNFNKISLESLDYSMNLDPHNHKILTPK